MVVCTFDLASRLDKKSKIRKKKKERKKKGRGEEGRRDGQMDRQIGRKERNITGKVRV